MTGDRSEAGRFLPNGEFLRDATDEQLEALYDSAVESANSRKNVVGSVNSDLAYATFVHDEINRRRSQKLTWAVVWLTVFIALLTLANVGLVAYSVLGSDACCS